MWQNKLTRAEDDKYKVEKGLEYVEFQLSQKEKQIMEQEKKITELKNMKPKTPEKVKEIKAV